MYVLQSRPCLGIEVAYLKHTSLNRLKTAIMLDLVLRIILAYISRVFTANLDASRQASPSQAELVTCKATRRQEDREYSTESALNTLQHTCGSQL